MDALDGKINVSFDYFENKLHDLILKSNWEFTKIDIAKGFSSFNNFEQTFITNKNIKGIGSATMYLQSMWDKNYKFYSPSLNMNSTLKIENGELIDFETMYELSDYVSLEELKNVKFATLENKIRIENEKIIIPKMDINSSAMSVFISGTHSFDNIMDYKVRLLLSDVLGNKVKESMSLDEIEHNHEGKTTIQLKMSGHVDDPKISLDKVKLKEDIGKEILKEGEEVIKIIENKILNKENPDTKEEKKEEEDGASVAHGVKVHVPDEFEEVEEVPTGQAPLRHPSSSNAWDAAELSAAEKEHNIVRKESVAANHRISVAVQNGHKIVRKESAVAPRISVAVESGRRITRGKTNVWSEDDLRGKNEHSIEVPKEQRLVMSKATSVGSALRNKEKIKHERIKAKEHRIQEVSNSGGDATKKIKESKKQIAINEANKLLKNPHDNRPPDRYRASSLAEAIKNISVSTSTIKKYIKEGVHEGALPSFLLDGKPKKW